MPTDRLDRLARQARRGDADALDAWFGAERPAVWKLCFGLLADANEAEDTCQDAMLHLSDHIREWDPRRAYAPWRTVVVANLCRDRRRRTVARRRAEDRAPEMPSRLPAPDGAAEGAEIRRALASALLALTDREREAFVLRDLEGLPARECAAAMGVGESTVRTLLSLARRRLRELLRERIPGTVPEGGRT